MKIRSAHLALLLALAPLFARGQAPPSAEEEKRADMRIPELDRSALEPEKRTPTGVNEGERNPFGLLSVPPPEEEVDVKIEAETEEMKIRRVLGNMRVTGLSGEPGSYRVLLGTTSLAEGDTVPRLFANQGEVLRVQEITDRQVLLAFVERRAAADAPPRTLALSIDLQPRVRSVLPGEFFTSVVPFDEKGAQALEPLKTETVETMVKQFKTNNLTEAVTDHRRALLGESYGSGSNEQPTAPDGE
ncbi:MAG: hypothetical protein ACKOKC_08070 [Chthoniobacterales bacterium]